MAERLNYFNYYTEIEEYFWLKRGQSLLISTLDWAVIESWQRAEVPLEVVLKGIDRAFESYDTKRRGRPIKSLLYCVDAVADAAEEAREASAGRGPSSGAAAQPAFDPEQVVRFLRDNGKALRQATEKHSGWPSLAATLREVAEALEGLAAQPATETAKNLEDLERHLTVLEEKVQIAATQALPAETQVEMRREVEKGLTPYRRKMKAEQVAMIEKQFLQRRLFEELGLPRLSLFYLPVGESDSEGPDPE